MASNQATVTQDLLARAHSPDSANRIYADKIQHRPLFVKPNSPPPPDARDLRRKARLDKQARARRAPKPRPLSSRQRRALGLHDVPKEGGGGQQKQKYAVFEPLHKLWLGYVREILGAELYTGGGGQGAAARLCSADFHGAVVEVTRSRCPSRVGIRGIVVKDSRFVFEVITRKNRVKIVPKEGTVFRVDVPAEDAPAAAAADDDDGEGEGVRKPFSFEIHGDQFQHRSADRTNKKFKAHFLENL